MKLSTLNCLFVGAVVASAAALPGDVSGDHLIKRQNVPVTRTFTALGQTQMQSALSSATATQPTSTAINTVVPTATGTVCPTPSVRVEWRRMTTANKSSLMQAIGCLWDAPPKGIAAPAKSRYEELVWVHQQMTGTVHQDGIFLPWHRYFVWIYETLLREECSYTGPLPWWNETADAGNFAASGLFGSQYYGSLPQVNSDGSTTCITDAAFQSPGKRDLHIGPWIHDTTHCLARGENTTITSRVNQAYVNYCATQTTYFTYEQCNEYGPHGLGHNGIGGTMSDVASSPGGT